ncbi:unnamed protein product [Bursaphelenchus okinawaensis]|uniref:Major facilitator superfamily (MFS) profile domain-containing protein n=1 Tax=Bursaphelenchus okinawaensis TaxID=465554 RepID=A0A811LUD1_9BILA|nr:unnamed protein product [Bursaphelenchus okinawaensis]CAG9127870.1 unnamed protein product [Bursaphelenchus okinawaensis]
MVGVATVSADINEDRPKNQPRVTGFVWLLASMSVLGGFLFGYDTGIVSSAMLYVVNNGAMRPMNHLWTELIIAITPAFAAVGSIFSGKFGDKFGRKRSIIVSSFIFAVGALLCGVATSKIMLLVGRVLLGLAIGVASMIVPVYVGECSPTHVRGKLVTSFNMMVCFGQFAASIVAGGLAYIDPNNVGWRLMFGVAAIPAIFQFVGFFFLPESPRWLYRHMGAKQSRKVLERVYGGDQEWIDFELGEIAALHEQEEQARAVQGKQNVLVKIWNTPHVRRALIIGCSLQYFNQLAGINTIMYYTGSIIKSTGVRDNHVAIWLSCITSFFNFAANLLPFFIVERFGRRPVILSSMVAVTVSLCLMAVSFIMVNQDTLPTISADKMVELTGAHPGINFDDPDVKKCLSFTNCDFCVTDDSCGFCGATSFPKQGGVCLPIDELNADIRASTGFCGTNSPSFMHNVSGVEFEWTDAFCENKYTILPFIIMVIYLISFSSGLSPMPWVLNAEFYPIWARGTCVSLSTFSNWIANLAVSMTYLTLTTTITRYGTFFLYAAITAFGFVIAYLYVPETKNHSLDEVEMLFMNHEELMKHKSSLKSLQSPKTSVLFQNKA